MTSVNDDYGLTLLAEDQTHDRVQSDSSDDEVENKVRIMMKLKTMFEPKQLPDINVGNKWRKLKTKVGEDQF